MAEFVVPLNLNKLDLKDYLWHAYRIPVLAVRSYIQQAPVQKGQSDVVLPRHKYWHRPRSTKRMIIEMGEGEHGGPFVWPEEVKDLEPWDKETYDKAVEGQDRTTERQMGGFYGTQRKMDGGDLKEQARRLLEGKERWRPSWQELELGRGQGVGRMVEVEKDVDLGMSGPQQAQHRIAGAESV
ncbi:MAG: hypothetical protein LQ340_007028 [Diploschistes diacapsis]|nr:MAG: hypothetical protein LQ340_007028 [Diploschistes diacapsis]